MVAIEVRVERTSCYCLPIVKGTKRDDERIQEYKKYSNDRHPHAKHTKIEKATVMAASGV